MQFSLRNRTIRNIATVVVLLSLVAAALGYMKYRYQIRQAFVHPVVVLSSIAGSSSAVHIGGGYFLAANHGISPDEASVELRSPGDDTAHVAGVLWKSLMYDIALVYAPTLETIDSYSLSCDVLTVGQNLQFHGNPGYLTGISTWGRVAGPERELPTSPWATVVPVDAVIIPGMSGGSVINEHNQLAGIMVGTLIMSPNPFSTTFTGISYIIPGNRLCNLIHRW
jgi:S1-C subfamily serine protease